MGAKHLWQHDSYFDYCDRWMNPDDPYAAQRGRFRRPRDEGRTFDPFVDAMWTAYRQTVPPQPGATSCVRRGPVRTPHARISETTTPIRRRA